MLQACFSIISKEGMVCKGERIRIAVKHTTLSRVVIWPLRLNPAMDCARDERISGERD